MLRIGIDLRILSDAQGAERTGVGEYIWQLLNELVDGGLLVSFELVVFYREPVSPELRTLVGRKIRYVSFIPLPTGRGFLNQVRTSRVFSNAKLDLLHIPGGVVPIGYRGKYVVTVHDLIIYRHPEWFPSGQWLSVRLLYPRTVTKAGAIIVPSEVVKNEVIALMGVLADRVHVIPHGVRASAAVAPRVREPFIFCVATLEPRKNILGLIRAFQKMKESHAGLAAVRLVLAGKLGWKAAKIAAATNEPLVEWVAYVSGQKKNELLAQASCFALFSFAEGFGMPLVEAMAAGTPVVASGIPVLKEVAGDAVLFADPNNVQEMADTLAIVLENKKIADELRAKGLVRASGFSWAKAARGTLEAYRLALHEGNG